MNNKPNAITNRDLFREIYRKLHAKKALLLFIAILCLTLSGCSKTLKQIKNGDVQTDEYNIDHTNLDNQDIFYVIPITTTVSNGKGGMSTSVTYVPMWTETDHLKITYWSNGHKKHLKTDSFDVEKSHLNYEYFKVKKGQVNKTDPDVVAYLKETDK